MLTRSSTATVTFANAFTLAGYPDALPPGEYQVLTDEELLRGISFEAYRTTATYLLVTRAGANSGRTELRATTAADIDAAVGKDRASTARNLASALQRTDETVAILYRRASRSRRPQALADHPIQVDHTAARPLD